MFTATQLAAEINTDPKSLGYAALKGAGGDQGIADKLNATYVGVATVYRADVKAGEILASLVASEVSAWTAVQWTALTALLIPGTVDASNARIRALFAALLPANSLANATAVATVTTPSRAQELWGANTTISATDVARALGRG